MSRAELLEFTKLKPVLDDMLGGKARDNAIQRRKRTPAGQSLHEASGIGSQKRHASIRQ